MQKPEVSVVVPVYNVARFVERCARSLFEQRFGPLEFVFVDDGSSDDSVGILAETIERYPERRPFVRIIRHEVNRGASAARNTGLLAARGEYVLYVDSDDRVDPDMVGRMYAEAKRLDCDIVWCDYFETRNGVDRYVPQRFDACAASCLREVLSGRMSCNLWNKLVRRNLYMDHSLRFYDGLNYGEDLAMTARLFCCASRVARVPAAFYHYEQDNQSALTKAPDRLERNVRELTGNAIRVVSFLEQRRLSGDFQEALAFLKLRSKRNLLLLDGREAMRQWRSLFPEADRMIFSEPGVALNLRIAQWAVSRRLFWINRMKNAVLRLRRSL